MYFLLFFSRADEFARLKELEDEQEMLNSSLLHLTTHFAQVQFRLKQIVSAPDEHKEVCKGGDSQKVMDSNSPHFVIFIFIRW